MLFRNLVTGNLILEAWSTYKDKRLLPDRFFFFLTLRLYMAEYSESSGENLPGEISLIK